MYLKFIIINLPVLQEKKMSFNQNNTDIPDLTVSQQGSIRAMLFYGSKTTQENIFLRVNLITVANEVC